MSFEFLRKQVIDDLKEFLPKGCFKLEEGLRLNGKELSWNEKWECMAAMYGNKLCYESDCNIINLTIRQYAAAKVLYALGNLTDSEKTVAEAEAAIKEYLYLSGQEKEPFALLLKNIRPEPSAQDIGEKPWLELDLKDPEPEQDWYTPARYFARQLVRDDSTLLTKRKLLAQKVAQSLSNVKIYKRGRKLPPSYTTILKALSKVSLG